MNRLKKNRGIAHIWAILMIPVMVGFTGLAVDMGYLAWTVEQLQACSDAAALAGAYYVQSDPEEARAAAARIALANVAAGRNIQLDLNTSNAPNGDIVLGRFDRDTQTFDSTSATPNAVMVYARCTDASMNGSVNVLFGPFLGRERTNPERMSIAMVGGGTGAGLIVLNEDARYALRVSGNVSLSVNNGAVQVNSTHPEGAYFGGSVEVLGDELNCAGDYRVTGSPVLPDDIETDAPKVADPLAFLAAPSYDTSADLGTVSMSGGTRVIQPGYYSGGIYTNGGSLTLTPGIYILDGQGFQVKGNANVSAPGVTLYLIGSGYLYLGGTGAVDISPPDPDVHSFPGASTYEGVTIFQARDNTNTSTIIGTGDMNLEGTFYFPANLLNVSGTSDQCGNQLIANRLEVSGNGNIVINYEGSFPAPGNEVFLVV